MAQGLIASLGYVGVEATDIAGWARLLRDICGAEVSEPDAQGVTRCRIDDYAWRIAIHPGAAEDMIYAGWECPTPEAFKAAVEGVSKAGVEIVSASPEEAKQRGVMALARFEIGSLPMELYVGPTILRHVPVRHGRPLSGFKTGPFGLGHIVVQTPEPEKVVALFRDVFGFKITDYVWDITFMRCNGRHHSIAVEPARPNAKRLAHFMLETLSVNDIGRGWDLVRKTQTPFFKNIGRHINDRMISFYVKTPSDFEVEYGADAIEVNDATWSVSRYDVPSDWGHKRQEQM